MEGMVNDLQLAREKHQNFTDWKRENGRSLMYDMVVSVLTTGFWPTYKVRAPLPFPFILPTRPKISSSAYGQSNSWECLVSYKV